MIKKIISTSLAAALTMTTIAVSAFAVDEPVLEAAGKACPITASASWKNYTSANIKLTFPSDNSITSAVVTLSDDFCLNNNAANRTLTINSSKSFDADLDLQNVDATTVNVIKSIVVTYNDAVAAEAIPATQEEFTNIDASLAIEGSFSSTAEWTNKGREAKVFFNSSNFAYIGDALVGSCGNIKFIAELNDGFAYIKDGNFVGLKDVGNAAENPIVTWSYAPADNEKNDYSTSGNGVNFFVSFNGIGAYNESGELPVFKSIKVTDGTTEVMIDSPILDYTSGSFKAEAEWSNNEKTVATVDFASDGSAVLGNYLASSYSELTFTGVLNDGFTYNYGKFDGLKGNEKGATTVIWKFAPKKDSNGVNFTVDYNGEPYQDGNIPVFKTLTVSGNGNTADIASPSLTVATDNVTLTLIDNGTEAFNEYAWGAVIEAAPAAAGISGYNFSAWTVNGTAVTFPYTLTADTTMTALYTVIPTAPVAPSEPEITAPAETTPAPQIDPTEPEVIIPDDETPLAGVPNEDTGSVIIGDEETPLGEVPSENGDDPLANPNTSDRSVTGTAMMIALAATGVAVIAFKKKK